MAPSLSPRARFLWGLAAGLGIAGYFAFSAILTGLMRRRGGGVWDDWPRLAGVLALSLVLGLGVGLLVVAAPAWLERRGVRPNRILLLRSFAPLGMIAALLATMGLARGSFLAAFLDFGFMLPIFVGMGIASAGHMRRVGDSRHCPRCDYEFGFADEAAAPRTCPECNEPWIGRLIQGTRRGSPRLIATGIVVALSAFVLMFGGAYGGKLARHMPTGALMAWVSAARFNDAPMSELAARSLTPDQAADLARRLLDRRAADRFSLGVGATKWLDAQVAAGTLPPDLRERFFAEMFTGSVYAPATVRVGEPFTVGLRDCDASDGFTHKCFVCIAGFGVGDRPATAGRSTDAHYPNLIDSARPTQYTPAATTTLVATQPGRTVVRVEIWIAAATRSPAPVAWWNGGNPSFAGPVDWTKKIVLERPLTVTE